jgi:D-alanyl-D-alanine carboxypeptidase
MALANGQIPLDQLAEIVGGHLRRDAARAWNDMRGHIIGRGGPAIRPTGAISAYRDLAGQKRMRTYWCGRGKCGNAAVPGTSNHGWGLAVDVPSDNERWLLEVGPRYRWSHDEGQRVGESWHFRYIGGYKPAPDPQRFLTATERSWIEELQRTRNPRRKRALKNRIRLQLNVIAREARKTGWQKRHRRERSALLRRYS